jgi:hypothetical protein
MRNYIETKDRLPTHEDAHKSGSLMAWSVEASDWLWCAWHLVSIKDHTAWIALAPYKPPTPECRPFTKAEFLPHANRWLEDRNGDYVSVNVICNDGVAFNGEFETWAGLLDRYTFVDDGTPCGVLV